jgi:predicted nucleotidyltransferase
VFFDRPTEDHYLIGISREIGLAHTSVKKQLNELLKQKIIIERILKKGTRRFPSYKANINGYNYRKEKMFANLISIQDSGLIEFLEEKIMPRCIVFFGSYSRGEDIEDSDIDLFIEASELKLDIKVYVKKLKRNIHLVYSEKFTDFSPELRNNIANGIVLYGFLSCYKTR